MLNSGYEGVREVAKRLKLQPWVSATSGVPSITSSMRKPTTPFINDAGDAQALLELNPHSFRRQSWGTLMDSERPRLLETSEENIAPAPGDLPRRSKTGIEGVTAPERRLRPV